MRIISNSSLAVLASRSKFKINSIFNSIFLIVSTSYLHLLFNGILLDEKNKLSNHIDVE